MSDNFPKPTEDFDDRTIPGTLLRTTLTLCSLTVVLQLYHFVASIKIYRMAVKAKHFWRSIIAQADREEMAHEGTTVLGQARTTTRTPTGTSSNTRRIGLQQLERQLRLMNWLEQLIDQGVVDRVLRGRRTSSITQETMSMTNTLKTENAAHSLTSIDAVAESDRRVIGYLVMQKPLAHECRMCSLRYDIHRGAYFRSVAYKAGHLINTLICK